MFRDGFVPMSEQAKSSRVDPAALGGEGEVYMVQTQKMAVSITRTAANSGRTSQNTGLEPPDLGPLNPPDFGAPGLASLRGLRPPGLRALELSATSKE